MEKNTSINIRRCENWQQLVPKKFGFDHTPVTIVIALATHFKLLTEIICLCLLASLRYTLCHHHFDYFPSLLEAFSSFNGDTSIRNRVNGCYRDQEYHKSNRVKSSLVKKTFLLCKTEKSNWSDDLDVNSTPSTLEDLLFICDAIFTLASATGVQGTTSFEKSM